MDAAYRWDDLVEHGKGRKTYRENALESLAEKSLIGEFSYTPRGKAGGAASRFEPHRPFKYAGTPMYTRGVGSGAFVGGLATHTQTPAARRDGIRDMRRVV